MRDESNSEDMRKLIPLLVALLMVSGTAAYSVALGQKTYVFHCNTTQVMCGGNLSAEHRPMEANFSHRVRTQITDRNISDEKIRELGKNLTVIEDQYTALASEASLERDLPIEIRYTERYLHEPTNSILDAELDFYPKKNYDEKDLVFKHGCWRTDVRESGSFYLVDWQKTYEPFYCIELESPISGAPSELLNLNPFTWR